MKFFSKKSAVFLLVLTLFLGLFLVKVDAAQGQVGEWLENLGQDILKAILNFLLKVVHAYTTLMAKIFTAILNFGFRSMGPVYTGWQISRDIVNMFFILGLVVIAFATILRIETYGMKALLIKFIVVALLINFSYLACGIIIDASQVAANYFVSQIQTGVKDAKPDVGFAVLDKLKVSSALTPPQDPGAVAITTSDGDNIILMNLAFSVALIAVAGFVLMIGAILLFMRMGALWLLIILAPFAWFLGIFPVLKHHNEKWWSELFKWSFFAPIYVFFIYLVLKIGEKISELTFTSATNTGIESTIETTSNLNTFAIYVFMVVLLMGAPTVAMSMGIKAAGTVTAFAKGAVRGTMKGAYKLPGRLRTAMTTPPGWMKAIPGVRKVTAGLQKVAIWTTPAYWKASGKARKEEELREAGIPEVLGKMHDVRNRVFSLFTKKTDFAEQAHQFEVNEEVKRMMLRTKGTSDAVIKEMASTKDRTKRDAGLTILGGNNDFNDLVQSPEFGKPYNQTFSRENFVDLFYKLQAESGVSERKSSAFLASLQEQALRAGTNFFGAAGVDKEGWKRNATEIMDEISARKAMTMDMRKWAEKTHPMSLIKLDVNNNYAGLDRGAVIALAKQMTPGVAKDLDFTRSRIDFVSKVGSPEAVADLRKLAKDVKALPTASAQEVVDIFADRLEKARTQGKGGKQETGGKKTKEEASEELFGGRL